MSQKVRALWKHSKNGKPYLAGFFDFGTLGQQKIAIFQKDRKEKDSTQPDYTIVLSNGTDLKKEEIPF